MVFKKKNTNWFFGEKATLTSVSLLIGSIVGVISITASLCGTSKSEDQAASLNAILINHDKKVTALVTQNCRLSEELKDCRDSSKK